MTKDRLAIALTVLQWVLGLIILGETLHFTLSSGAAPAFAKTGLPDFVRQGLAWAEIAAALLFLIPRATWAGGWFLIGVLVFAIILHILHGWFDVSALVVYIAATYAVMTGKRFPTSASRQERT
jgi:uncharacterized membrane protein YphA (DoxX/SURF4 family)